MFYLKYWEKIEKHAGLLGVLIAIMVLVRWHRRNHAAVRQGSPSQARTRRQALRRPAPGRQGRLRARRLLPVPLADDPHAALRGPSATVNFRPPRSRCTTGRSSGAPSAPGRTWRESAASTPMPGSTSTCSRRARWCRNPTCQTTRGWRRRASDTADIQARMRTLRTLGDPYNRRRHRGRGVRLAGQDRTRCAGGVLAGTGCARGGRTGGGAMSPVWGHAIGVIILLLMLVFNRGVVLGLVAASQGRFRQAGPPAHE